PVGGSVMAYQDLARYLRPEQRVYALENQIAFDNRMRLYRTVEEMAAHYVEEICSVQPEGPYLLGGYSMGGAVAFEGAQQPRRRGKETSFVAVIDTPVRVASRPGAEGGEAVTAETLILVSKMIAQRQDKNLDIAPADLERRSPQERLDYVLEILKANGLVPARADAALFRELLRAVKNNIDAQRKYVPTAYGGRGILFHSLEA